jgi:hypothetical protein
MQNSGPTTGAFFALDDRDVVAAADEVTRGREAREAGPDHNNGVHARAPITIMVRYAAQLDEMSSRPISGTALLNTVTHEHHVVRVPKAVMGKL